MIDGLMGNNTIPTLVKSQDEVITSFQDLLLRDIVEKLTPLLPPKRYIDLGQRTYSFAPVKGTDYR